MKYSKYWLLALVVMLASCTSVVKTEVKSFHQWPQNKLTGQTFKFETDDKADDFLEQQYYQKQIAQQLRRYGLNWQQDTATALTIKTKLDIKPTTEWRSYPVMRLQNYYIPPYVYQDGDKKVVVPGYWATGGYEWVGNDTYSYRVFLYQLKLGIYQHEKKLYESTAALAAGSHNPTKYVPYLIKSIFADFPGKNGQRRNYKINTKSGEFE